MQKLAFLSLGIIFMFNSHARLDMCEETNDPFACRSLVAQLASTGDPRTETKKCDFYSEDIINCNPYEEYQLNRKIIYSSGRGEQVSLCSMSCRAKVQRNIPSVCDDVDFTNPLNYFDAHRDEYDSITDTFIDIMNQEICEADQIMNYMDNNGVCEKSCLAIDADRGVNRDGDDIVDSGGDNPVLENDICLETPPTHSELSAYFSSLDGANNTEEYQRQIRACLDLTQSGFSLYRDPENCELLRCDPPDEDFPGCQHISIPIAPCNENEYSSIEIGSLGMCEMVCLPKEQKPRKQLPDNCDWVDSSREGISYSTIANPGENNVCQEGETCIGLVSCEASTPLNNCIENPEKVAKEIAYVMDPCEIFPDTRQCMSCQEINNSEMCNQHETPYETNACKWNEDAAPVPPIDGGYYTVECKNSQQSNGPCPVSPENCTIIKEGI